MTPDEMAAIHARAMRVPPPWDAPAMTGFLSAPGAIFVHRPQGFALGRAVADEAELLTLAVDPDAQRRGVGRSCLRAFLDACRAKGAARVFLEVARTNHAAQRLYAGEGFVEDGVRRSYYALPGGGREDAVLMHRPLDD